VTYTTQVTVEIVDPCLTTVLDTFDPFSLTVSELLTPASSTTLTQV